MIELFLLSKINEKFLVINILIYMSSWDTTENTKFISGSKNMSKREDENQSKALYTRKKILCKP